MKKLAECIAQYIEDQCGDASLQFWLSQNYIWPKKAGDREALYEKFNLQDWTESAVDVRDDSCYVKTSKIKAAVEKVLAGTAGDADQFSAIRFFLNDWGKVNVSDETLRRLVKLRIGMAGPDDVLAPAGTIDGINRPRSRFALKATGTEKTGNVSSWSKYLAVAFPEWALIYDSRVAYAINAIIYLHGLADEPLWPMPDGVNSKLNLIDIETIILASQGRQRRAFEKLRALQGAPHRVSRFRDTLYHDDKDTYQLYLALIEKVHSILEQSGKVACTSAGQIEAFLFMVADGDLFEMIAERALAPAV
ncbi:hypothetical protein [Microbulbifer sp. YPW1]|uniref:hypothetical protein n=1 Tax=Microbulbifer sp. YPW1 TaxID=2745199 RepID=UPI001599230B|nr:hypothetical protein [Microbulbifer sp. YPW1]QKX16913.1 hypothetical protein HUW35_07810 [Microbulbifer sp. YPW1]